jgi:hypothetical protein
MKVKLAQIKDNPYRDRSKFPISRVKVDGLKESMGQTGFWDNVLARPAGNAVIGIPEEQLPAYLASQAAAFDASGEPLFPVELAYGHHRLEALRELGIEEVDIPVKAINNVNMLQIMANENKGDWASNMSVILETVRQTRTYLLDTVAPYGSYDEYMAANVNPFFSKEQFAQIPEQGIGFKTIRKFLGETWAEGDIRNAVATLKNIDDGLYEQEQVIAFPSIGVLGAFAKVAEGIMAQNWPAFFKRKSIDSIATMVGDPAISTTVRTLTQAKEAVGAGKDPVRVVKNPGLKRVDFNIVDEIKDLVYENMTPGAPTIDDIPTTEGFVGFEGLDKILEEVKKSIGRSEAAKKGATDKVAAAEGAAATAGTNGETMSQEELDQVIKDAENSVGATTPATSGPIGLPDVPDEATPESASIVAERFAQSTGVMCAQIDAFGAQLAEITEPDHPAFTAAENLYRRAAALFVAIYSAEDAGKTLQEVIDGK